MNRDTCVNCEKEFLDSILNHQDGDIDLILDWNIWEIIQIFVLNVL